MASLPSDFSRHSLPVLISGLETPHTRAKPISNAFAQKLASFSVSSVLRHLGRPTASASLEAGSGRINLQGRFVHSQKHSSYEITDLEMLPATNKEGRLSALKESGQPGKGDELMG